MHTSNTMNVLIEYLIFFCILFYSGNSCIAQEELFQIPSFIASDACYPAAENTMVHSLQPLLQIDSLTRLKKHHLLVRRRFSAFEYGMYSATQTDLSFQRLSRFKLPLPLKSMIHLKLYTSEAHNTCLDIAQVYFDTEFIYAENIVRLYYHDAQGWKNISMQKPSGYEFQVNSVPENCDVLLDGVLIGNSPLRISHFPYGFTFITFRKKGYYLQDAFVKLSKDSCTNLSVMLTPIMEQAKTIPDASDEYTAEIPESIQQLDDAICDIQKQLLLIKNVFTIPRSPTGQYPSRIPSSEDDNSFFNMVYCDKLIADTRHINGIIPDSITFEQLSQQLEQLSYYKQTIQNKKYTHYISGSSIKSQHFFEEKKALLVKIFLHKPPYRLWCQGFVVMPQDIAYNFMHTSENSLVKLSYKNRLFRKDNKTLTLYEYSAITILFNRREFPITFTGTIIRPQISDKEYSIQELEF